MNPYEPPAVMDSKAVDHPIGVFRSSLPFVIGVGIVITLPIAVFLFAYTSPFRPLATLLFEIAPFQILVSIVYALFVAYFKIYFYSNRIRGYNAWGIYHDLALTDVERVNPIDFLGVKYVRVYSRHGTRVMWIPLFLKGLDRFVNLVCQHSESNNALVLYFKSVGMVPGDEGRRATKGN